MISFSLSFSTLLSSLSSFSLVFFLSHIIFKLRIFMKKLLKFLGISLNATTHKGIPYSQSLTSSYSFLEPLVMSQVSDCGYCKMPGSSVTDYLMAYSLRASDYEQMMDLGWRRSGVQVYRPVMEKTCCPAYPIRLQVDRFEFSKSHQKTMVKFARGVGVDLKKSATSKTLANWMEALLSVPENRFRIETTIASFDSEAYSLFVKYQVAIHGDKRSAVTREQYIEFLVHNPFSEPSTLHQKYFFNDTLVAVAVLDILPSSLSSVYLFYDPDYKHLDLGKFSALYEIYQTMQQSSEARFYYMGYYIHSCSKMKYKASYAPSDLLDPVTKKWHPLTSWTPHLDQHKLVSFEPSSQRNSAIANRFNLMSVKRIVYQNISARLVGIYYINLANLFIFICR